MTSITGSIIAKLGVAHNHTLLALEAEVARATKAEGLVPGSIAAAIAAHEQRFHAPVVVPAPGAPTIPAGSKVLFLDAFAAPGLDLTKWNHPSDFHCCGSPATSGGFVAGYDGPIRVPGDGFAYLDAVRDPANLTHWHVPIMDTKGKAEFTPTTGGGKGVHLEVRGRQPAPGRGVWPALLWMYGASGVPEIDVNETLANLLGTAPQPQYDASWNLVHVHYAGGQFGAGAQSTTKAALSDAMHTYGVDWYPDRIMFYLDGLSFATFNPVDKSQVPAGPLYALTNVGISDGKDWGGNLAADATTPSPATAVLDWVAAWTL